MLFLYDKRKDPKNGFSYVTNREEDKYTMIEGNVELFDKIAFTNIAKGKKEPYDTLVLSFEEEDMTMDEMFEIYNDWKDMYLGSYDENEIYLTSVIHWDDDHPHIHIGVIRHSMINDKELRMTRIGKDNKLFGRNDAIQEVLNYKYGLSSPHDKLNLYPTTPEQKKRDRKVKKGTHEYYEVEDDSYYDFMRIATVKANSFDNFIETLEGKYGDIEFKQIHNDERIIKIGNKRFKSVLFNKEFYNNNIEDIKKGVETFKGKRKSEEFYKDLWEEKNYEHKKQLSHRNIHEGLLESKLNCGELEFLANALDIDKEFEKIRQLKSYDFENETKVEKFKDDIENLGDFLFCKEDIELYFNEINMAIDSYYSHEKGLGFVTFNKDGVDIVVEDQQLYNNLQKNRGDIGYVKDLEVNRIDKIKSKIKKMELSKRENIELLRSLISNEIIEAAIKNKDGADDLFKKLGIEKINEGYSSSKGGYITLKVKNKKFALYDDYIHGLYQEEVVSEDVEVIEENGLIKSSLMDERKLMKPESVLEFKLNNSNEIDFSITNQEAKDEEFVGVPSQRDRKSIDRIDDETNNLLLRRSLNLDKSVIKLVNQVKHREWKHIKLSGTDIEYQRETVKTLMSLSSQGYNSDSWLKDLKVDCDFYENSIHIKDGVVYEIEDIDLLDIMDEKKESEGADTVTIKDGVKLKESKEDIKTIQKIKNSSALKL